MSRFTIDCERLVFLKDTRVTFTFDSLKHITIEKVEIRDDRFAIWLDVTKKVTSDSKRLEGMVTLASDYLNFILNEPLTISKVDEVIV